MAWEHIVVAILEARGVHMAIDLTLSLASEAAGRDRRNQAGTDRIYPPPIHDPPGTYTEMGELYVG